tara:strand:+ start:374 stop:574 length:201 start_codon:yes stop_codon:yes gene_type:complete
MNKENELLLNRANKELDTLNVICSSVNLNPCPSEISIARQEIKLIESYIEKQQFIELKEYFEIIDF